MRKPPSAIPDELAITALLRQEFGFFLRMAFAEVGGERELQFNWHLDAVEHRLDQVRLGACSRQIVTMPPRHLKSVMITCAWVAWMLGKNPSLRFICASYGYDLAEKHARDCQRIMATDWYRAAFPNVRLIRRAVMDFETSAGGGRLSTSVGGVITGRGANIVIIDDPMKADDALSEVERAKVTDWFDTSLISRLDDPGRSAIIVVMQRLHEGDLAGELLRRGGWDELRLSAIATHDELVPLTRGRTYQRRAGHPLHDARVSLAELEKSRKNNPYIFAAQSQQDPVSRIGAFVKAVSFGIYDTPPDSSFVVQSWDTAIKATVRSDWSVGITAAVYMNRFYILDVYRKRVEFGELQAAVNALCLRHRVTRLLVEDAGSGQSLIQELRRTPQPGVVAPIRVTSSTDKIVRFEAQASKIEAGMVVLPRSAPWLADFVNELVKFPGARHDDQADALAQMLANTTIYEEPEIAAPILVDFDDSEDDDPDGNSYAFDKALEEFYS